MASSKSGLKVIAALEAFKGVLSLLVGFGLHVLAGRNLQQLAESLVTHAHLNPASHLPRVFIQTVGDIPNHDVGLVSIGAFAYATIRFIEAYGLWKAYLWTEWFALASGAIYLPFEIYELFVRTNVLTVVVLAVNIAVVWYMARVLFTQKRTEALE
ncbi:DUF2127 domain-containing protein [Shewanella sp. C32]|uniref:DUF2127 domain-containing protein n=1 Tax=Shewanella electrica TaxID=515560 RepID=A0ABT2FIN7_9GAMM|nr:DUF2127 domain-containing protein [Shewanella electrica]MCH1923954.1 DUF2127 domain-containing protein [Shewanella electrica]MCS4555857.1 DUF2127 domain-containing protein [Shewanella electrica]